MSASTLTIDRISLAYHAAASFARAEGVTRRITGALEGSLSSALERLPDWAFAALPDHVFIERLDLTSVVAAHWSDDEIASRVAQSICRTLFGALDRGEALAFRDRAELVAVYAATLLDPGSEQRWWFAEFDGLAFLPPSQRLRTLMLREGRDAFIALGRMPADRRDALVSLLTEADLVRLGEMLPPGAPPSVTTPQLAAAIKSATNAAVHSAAHGPLVVLLQLVSNADFEPTRQALRFAAIVWTLVAAARAGRLPPPTADAGVTLVRWLDELVPAEPDACLFCADAADAIVASVTAEAIEPLADEAAPREPEPHAYTRHGGALLLCVQLERLGWWSEWQASLTTRLSDEPEAARLAAALALEVVARALAPRATKAITCDAALQRVFRADEGASLGLTASDRRLLSASLRESEYSARICAAQRGFIGRSNAVAGALLSALAERIPGLKGSSPAYIRRQVLDLPATVSADGTEARLGRAPLDVLLELSGLKRASAKLPHGHSLTLSSLVDP